MTNRSANKQKKGTTMATRRPKSLLRKRRNKEMARARKEARRAKTSKVMEAALKATVA